MKERPILFSAPMVRAILAGAKTQTRRALRGFYPRNRPEYDSESGRLEWFNGDEVVFGMNCPYGQPGDRLWVREAFHGYHWDKPRAVYRADGERQRVRTQIESYEVGRWTPSIHMPRWASRITLEVTGVRVERLQDISQADAVAEGCPMPTQAHGMHPWPEAQYRDLWESINGPGSWDANPWVWVIEFRRLP